VSRPLRIAGYIVIGIVTGLLLATLAILVLTRTDWGMERARRFAVEWLADRIDGELHIARISGGGLLGGVVLHDFGITDPRGRPFLSSDSLEVAYDWRTLIRGRIVLNRVLLYGPKVAIEKLPGDTLWNYEMVFPDTTPGPSTSERSLIMFRDARIYDGTATVRMAFEPGGPIEPNDTARVVLETVNGGLVRTMQFEDIDANLDRVIWESPLEKGRMFDVRSVSARGFIWRDPLLLQNARGTLTMRDSVVAFDMAEVALPGSTASMVGRITMGAERNDLDIRIEGRRINFDDFQWAYPGLPDEGGGSVVLRIRTQPDGVLWLAEDANISTPGSRVAGTVGVVTGDTMYFTTVNLRASPLDVQLLEQLIPGGLPIEGLLVGTVEVRGPISALETRGDLRLAGDVAGAGSHVAWTGVLDARRGRVAARSMHADVKNLELALIPQLTPQLKRGRVSGTFEGSGPLDRLRFTAALDHASDGGGRSRFDGGGTITGQGRERRIDLTVTATPVTLQDLSEHVPALRGLQGELTGPVHLEGTARDLGFDAELLTPGGPLAIAGRVRNDDGASPHVTATAQARGFALHALHPDLPATWLRGRITVDLTGRDLATFAGPVSADLDSLRIGALPYASVLLNGSLGDGALTVDSAALVSPAGTARAMGRVALVDGREGRLDVGFTSQSLAPLESYLFDGAPGADAEPRVAGRADALLSLTGAPGAYSLDAEARGDDLVFGTFAARGMTAQLRSSGLGGTDARFRLTTNADSFAVWRHVVQAAQLEAEGTLREIGLAVVASSDSAESLRARAQLAFGEDSMALRLDSLRLGSVAPWTLFAPATASLENGLLHLDRAELRRNSGARAVAGGRLAWASDTLLGGGPPIDFSVDLTGVPFHDVLRSLGAAGDGSGAVEARMRLYGNALDPLLDAELTARDVVYGDLRIDQAFAELSYSSRGLDAHAEAQHGGRSILTGGGRIPLDLRLASVGERRLDEAMRVTVRADSMPPALPLNLLDGFSNTAGRIDGEIVAAGTTLNPRLSGGFTLARGAMQWDVSGVRYADVNGSLTLERDRVLRIDLTARAEDPNSSVVRTITGQPSVGGNGAISGTLDFAQLTDPRFDLRIFLSNAYGVRRREVEGFASGVAFLEGRYSRPEVRGRLRVQDAALHLDEILRQFYVAALEFDDQQLMSLVDTSLVAVRPLLAASKNPFLRALRVHDLELQVGSNSWLRSQDMDVEVTGDLTINLDRIEDDLRLSGILDVQRGTYTLYFPPFISRRFRVSEGTIEFPGTPGIDPNLAITAAYRARIDAEPLDIVAGVSGTLQTPRIRLSSQEQPNVSESDLASLLFFGVRTWELVGTSGTQNEFRAVTGRALQPSLFGYASSGLQTLVQNAGLLDYISLTAGDMLPTDDARGLGGLFAGTRLELGRYLPWGNIYLGYTQRLSSANLDAGARMEWRFLPEYSFELFAEDRLARMPGFGLRQETGQKKVYGFSLFREWSY